MFFVMSLRMNILLVFVLIILKALFRKEGNEQFDRCNSDSHFVLVRFRDEPILNWYGDLAFLSRVCD